MGDYPEDELGMRLYADSLAEAEYEAERHMTFTPDISQPNGPAKFPNACEVGPREWGRELLLLAIPGLFTLKKIIMKPGAKGGLQYHHKKDEGGIVISGEMIVRFDKGDGKLSQRVCREGDVFWFPQGAVHQAEAVTECIYIEVSTPFLNDRVHCEHLYGIDEMEGGLPSTLPGEVQTI